MDKVSSVCFDWIPLAGGALDPCSCDEIGGRAAGVVYYLLLVDFHCIFHSLAILFMKALGRSFTDKTMVC